MDKKSLLLIAFVAAKFLFQYSFILPEYELHRDEFLHLDQADHLAWGYLSVPPLTSWVSCIISFLGNTPFFVRFFPALFGALTIVLVWKAVEELKGGLFALSLAATAVLLSALLRLNMLYHPNSFDVLAWTALAYVLIKYSTDDNPKWLYAAAVVFGIGFLNKYNIAFWLIGLLPALLLTKRGIFTHKELYLSALLGLLIVAPNLAWQYQNSFPVFHHLDQLAKTQLVNMNRLDFLKEQMLFFIGSLLVLLASLYALLFYPPFKKHSFFFWALCFTLAVFTYLRAKGYYAIGLYPIYFAFGAVFLEDILKTGKKRYLRPAALALPVLVFADMSQLLFPNKSPEHFVKNPERYQKLGLLRWEDGQDHPLPQDFADMLAWKELAQKTEALYESFPKEEQTLILCDNYGQAGAINYYVKNKSIKAVSFNADYIDWFELDKKTDNFIRIKEAESEDGELQETGPFFGISYLADSLTNRFAREYGTKIYVFRQPNTDINKRLQEEIDDENGFRR